MKVIINGANGAMGRVITKLCEEGVLGAFMAARADKSFISVPDENKYHALSEFKGAADVVIDFSHHLATQEVLSYCILKNLPLLLATTGRTPEEEEMVREASGKIPVFCSANLSLGVAVLADIAERVVSAFPEAEIEIVETHHDRKVDVPSGTALMLADRIKEIRPDVTYNIGRPSDGKRTKEEIGIHSLRYGNVTGIHEIIISTGNETIKLIHEADNRSLFADGAMKAAAFIAAQRKPGLYGMDSIL